MLNGAFPDAVLYANTTTWPTQAPLDWKRDFMATVERNMTKALEKGHLAEWVIEGMLY